MCLGFFCISFLKINASKNYKGNKRIQDGGVVKYNTVLWTLHHLLKQPFYRHFYPLLSNLAECCLSIATLNAWPECGASALKRIKTRLRSRLQNDMLQTLMQVSITGPPLQLDQCKELVSDSVQLWLKQKKGRTLSKKGASTDHRGSVSEHIEMAGVGVQVETVEADKVKLSQMRWHQRNKQMSCIQP